MFLRWLFATLFLLLLTVATLNYAVDPAGIYRGGQADPRLYAEALRHSRQGLWWSDDSFDDRKVKAALSRHAREVDCVVIGSSHAMQVGNMRQTPSLSDPCRSILNLAVSGASIEDHLTLAYLAVRNGAHRVMLGTDPWVLTFGKEPRWSSYSRDYDAARQAILGSGAVQTDGQDTLVGKVKNLFSLAYTERSIALLRGGLAAQAGRFAIRPAPRLDEAVGGAEPVLLPDGSLVYSASFVQAARARPIPIGGEVYMTDGRINTEEGIKAYAALLRWLRQQGSEPLLLLTPYQQNVWLPAHSPTRDVLVRSEALLRNLARANHVRVLGSYDPRRVGCEPGEFYDFMHATPACLAHIH